MSNLDDSISRRRRIREEAVKQRKAWKRRELRQNILVAVLGSLAVVGVIAAIIAFGGLIFFAAWNLGVVNIASAAGGSVATINFWTAIGGSLAVGILSRIFRRTPTVQAEAKG